MIDGCASEREQQPVLAAHPLEIGHERLLDPVLRAHADLVDDVDQQVDERVGDLRRDQHSTASSVSLIGAGIARRSDGYAADARARHAPSSFSEQSANRSAGNPIARTRSSLSISSRIVFKLAFPGSLFNSTSNPAVDTSSFVGTLSPFEGYTGGGAKEIIDGMLFTGDLGHLNAARSEEHT